MAGPGDERVWELAIPVLFVLALVASWAAGPSLLAVGVWLLVGAIYVFTADARGEGEEEWQVEPERVVIRRKTFGRLRTRQYAGAATLQLRETRDSDTHNLALIVQQGEKAHCLLYLYQPPGQTCAELRELARRLSETTGWKLVPAPR